MTVVAVDGRRLQDRPLGGVGRSLSMTLPFLCEDFQVVVLTDRRRPAPAISGARFEPLAGLGNLPEVAWLQVSAAAWLLRHKGTLFHGVYNTVPVASRNPAVVTIHDLSWEHHPEDHTPARRLFFQAQARWAARHAGAIVTVSGFVRDELMETYGVERERVFVAPNPVDPAFSPDRAGARSGVLEAAGVRSRYVVALGGARRRGLDVAVDAWRRLAQRLAPEEVPLVVIGEAGELAGKGVVGLGRVDDETWASVLAGAAAFCYPTRYEGFGMPAIEAAASGVPVVCAPVASLPEVLGDAAEWCATPSAEDMAAGLERVLTDPARHEALRVAGLERAAKSPGAPECAAPITDAYRFALSNGSRANGN